MKKWTLCSVQYIVGLLLTASFYAGNVYANEIAVKSKIKVTSKSVNSLCFYNGALYLNSDEGIKIIAQNSRSSEKIATNETKGKGMVAWNGSLCTVDSQMTLREVAINNTRSKVAKTSNAINLSSQVTTLSKNSEHRISCANSNEVFVVVKEGWSSRIEALNPETGEKRFITYISGNPAGISFEGNTLWYIGNRTNKNSSAVLYSYDLTNKTTQRASVLTPCTEVSGLAVDETSVWTYSNTDGYLYRLEKGGK